MRAIDTNVLVRLLVRDDPDQVARAEAFVEHGAWVSLPVLVETVWVMQSVYGLNRRRIGTVVGMLVEHEYLTLQDEDVVRQAHATLAGSTGFSDCLVVEIARKAGHVPVGTFDRKMSQVDMLVTPAQRSAGSAARPGRVAPLARNRGYVHRRPRRRHRLRPHQDRIRLPRRADRQVQPSAAYRARPGRPRDVRGPGRLPLEVPGNRPDPTHPPHGPSPPGRMPAPGPVTRPAPKPRRVERAVLLGDQSS